MLLRRSAPRSWWPRFSLAQLLLLSTLVAILAGAWSTFARLQALPTPQAVALSPDGTLLVATFTGAAPAVWRREGKRLIAVNCPKFAASKIQSDTVRAAGGSRFFVVRGSVSEHDDEAQGEVWDLSQDRRVLQIPLGDDWDAFVATEADAIVSIHRQDPLLREWNISTGELQERQIRGGLHLSSGRLAPSGKFGYAWDITVGDSDIGDPGLVDLQTWSLVRRIPEGATYCAIASGVLAWSVDSQNAAGESKSELFVANYAADAKPHFQLDCGPYIHRVRFLPDGNRLLLQRYGSPPDLGTKTLQVWDVRRNQRVCEIPQLRLNDPILWCGTGQPWQDYANNHAYDVSHDGKFIATAEYASVCFWDGETGRLIAAPYSAGGILSRNVYISMLVLWAVAWAVTARWAATAVISRGVRTGLAQVILLASGGYWLIAAFASYEPSFWSARFGMAEALAAFVATCALAAGLSAQRRAMLGGALLLVVVPWLVGAGDAFEERLIQGVFVEWPPARPDTKLVLIALVAALAVHVLVRNSSSNQCERSAGERESAEGRELAAPSAPLARRG